MASGGSSGVSRRKFIRGAATASAAAITGRGIYGLLQDYATPTRVFAAPLPPRDSRQYVIQRMQALLDNNVVVMLPPLYNDVFTANLSPAVKQKDKSSLVAAQQRLENALLYLESFYPGTAAGLTVVVGWGLSYFNQYVPDQWALKAPVDVALTNASGQKSFAVLDAIRFPSDPPDVTLENNHVAFKMRSDDQRILQSIEAELFTNKGGKAYVGDLFILQSKRIGFLGRGFGTSAVARTLAQTANVPGADSIPLNAQLTMGFTSTQQQALGADAVPAFETLRGITDQWPNGYFRYGTNMHLSHLKIDLDLWYGNHDYKNRVARMFSPSTAVPTDGTVTIPNGPAQVATLQQVQDDIKRTGLVGHNAALQQATRMGASNIDNYGAYHQKGEAVPIREDFNTLDNPFTWFIDSRGQVQTPPANQPGLHFAVFVPTSDRFHRARRAMDGFLPNGVNLRDGTNLQDENIGFNSLMHATHRQNFLVPGRAHRSFPLAELLP
jgi:hypothetical protein